MSKTVRAIRKRNEQSKKARLLKEEEINSIRKDSLFRIRLMNNLQDVDKLLKDPNVSYVVIEIPNENLTDFMNTIYSEQMKFYNIVKRDNTDKNLFQISRKDVIF